MKTLKRLMIEGRIKAKDQVLLKLNDGTPSDNGMKFCCYCGKRLKQLGYVDA